VRRCERQREEKPENVVLVTVLWSVFGVGLLVWAGTFVGLLWANRPREIKAGLPLPEPGPERPAIAGLLTNGCAITGERAASATLLDLAARGYLRLSQHDGDPSRTVIHLRDGKRPTGLEPYERRVLTRIRDLASGGVLPLTRLPFDDAKQARSWGSDIEAEVVRAAEKAGLLRGRFTRTHRLLLYGASCVPAIPFGLVMGAGARGTDAIQVTIGGAAIALVWLNVLAHLPLGVRETTAGARAAARQKGFRDWLRAHGSLAEEPPAGVTVWGRNEAYGVAFGLNRFADDLIDFGVGRRDLIWSHATGVWRQVRVRYPRNPMRHGATMRSLRSGLPGAALLGVAALVLGYWLVSILALLHIETVTAYLITAGVVLLMLRGLFRTVYGMARLFRERDQRVAVNGVVLRVDPWWSMNGDARHHLVVDDGGTDDLTAWCLADAGRCEIGERVHVEALPWSRRVLLVKPLRRTANDGVRREPSRRRRADDRA
jgi:hypothetical protein